MNKNKSININNSLLTNLSVGVFVLINLIANKDVKLSNTNTYILYGLFFAVLVIALTKKNRNIFIFVLLYLIGLLIRLFY
jgi:hypothetical protein